MSEQPDGNRSSSAVMRAEQFWNNTNQRIQSLLNTTGQQFQQATHDLQAKTNQMTKPSMETQETSSMNSTPQDGAKTAPSTGRAEQLVNTWGQQLGDWLGRTGNQVARTTARLRENTEDIWAEAQHIRHSRNHPG